MRHRLLGPSGLRVSQICLGGMTFGEPKSWGASSEAAEAILARFVDAGGTFIDTAPNYASGASEQIIGEFAKPRRDELVLATKYTASASAHPVAGGNSRRTLRRSIEHSLQRLKTDHIDLLWLHYWDGTTPLEEILRSLDDLVTAGKVLYVGLSDTPAWLVSRAATLAEIRRLAPVIAVQLEYNVACRTAERELLPMAEALGLGVVAWGGLAAGALASGDEPRRRHPNSLPPSLRETALDLKKLAIRANRRPAGLALDWICSRDYVPIIGARTPEQLSNVLDGAIGGLDASLVAELDGLAAPELGFPHEMLRSPYLRRLALGSPDQLIPPSRGRA